MARLRAAFDINDKVRDRRVAMLFRNALWNRSWQLTEVRSMSPAATLITDTGMRATMLAVRARSIRKPISPKLAPGLRTSTFCPLTRTTTSPETST